jgi:hypothetical protein
MGERRNACRVMMGKRGKLNAGDHLEGVVGDGTMILE